MGRCYNSATINAPSDQVWDTIKDFHDLSWAAGVITKLEKQGENDGNTPGAKRILNEAFHETFLSVDKEQKLFTYSIDDGPEPLSKDSVQNYVATVKVYQVTQNNTSFVEWIAEYESPDDEAVDDFCNPVYHALLTALKEYF